MVKIKYSVILLSLIVASICNAGTYTTSYTWELDPVAYAEDNGKVVIVRVYSNGKEICAAYDNMTDASGTTAECTFDHAPGRADQVGQAEWSTGTIWLPETPYELGDKVVAPVISGNGYVHFECTRAGTSGAVEPSWITADGTVFDDPDGSGVEWTTYNATIIGWQANTTYDVGDRIKPVEHSIGGNQYLGCTRAGTSGTTEPDWSNMLTKKWYRFFRFYFLTNATVNDPDFDGAEWTLRKRGAPGKVSQAMKTYFPESATENTRLGRSLN